MSISSPTAGASSTVLIDNFSGGVFKDSGDLDFTFSVGDTITSTVVERATDGSAANAYISAIPFFELPFAFGNGTGVDQWSLVISSDFFAAHVGTEVEFEITLNATNSSGQPDGSWLFTIHEGLQPFEADRIQNDYHGITRGQLPSIPAQAEAHAIDTSVTTEFAYVNELLASVANTTIPAVAVEGSMYDHVGTSAEIDNLVNNFLPAQVTTALNNGLNPQVYACEVLGLAFAPADENGGTDFASLFGPSSAAMPNTLDGDASFASAASNAIFAADAGPQTPDAIAGFVANWKAFYTSNGIPGVADPTDDQIDLYARGAAWGDAVGVALANNLGPLPGQVINFLEDAAQGRAIDGASLAAQPTPHPFPFEGETSSASTASDVRLAGIPADAHQFGM